MTTSLVLILLTNAVLAGEDGTTGSYELKLTSQPVADVVVAIQGDAQATPDRASLTFTTENWNQVQAVTVGAVDDAVAEADGDGLLQHTVT